MAWVDEFLRVTKAEATASLKLARALRERATDTVVPVHRHAWPAHEAFMRRRYADGRPRVVALSMNPARNGAVQTGLSFTDTPTARALLPDFDELVHRPAKIQTDQVEMSGQKLGAWATERWGSRDGLYDRFVFPIACPVAVLRGPGLLNVPLPSLGARARQAAGAFYEEWAPRIVRACQPRGVLLLGHFAGRRWEHVRSVHPDLARLPHVVTHHPAARITNEEKFGGWDAALRALEAS